MGTQRRTRADGATKYLDTNFPATSLRDDCHLCYIEQQPAIDSGPRTALGVTNGPLERFIGAVDAFSDRTAIIGDPAVVAQISGGYNDWTSLYIANREAANSLRLFKRTHLKDTETTATATNPKPSLNLFVGARNNNGTPDQFFKNPPPLRFCWPGAHARRSDTILFPRPIAPRFAGPCGPKGRARCPQRAGIRLITAFCFRSTLLSCFHETSVGRVPFDSHPALHVVFFP